MRNLTHTTSMRPIGARAITIALLLGACSTATSADTTPAAEASTTAATAVTPTTVVVVNTIEPEVIRDQVLAAIAASDDAALEALVPAASLESVGAQFATFVPAADVPACDILQDGRANCIVFEDGLPFALSMTLEPSDTLGWTIAAVSYDSTN